MHDRKANSTLQQPFICVVAGGSGGHLIPGLELAQRWVNDNKHGRIILITTTKRIDQTIVSHYPQIATIVQVALPTVQLKKLWTLPYLCTTTLSAFIKSFQLLRRTRPTHVISTGGFVSLPVAFAAKLLKIPFDLYELNAVPGKAARVLALLSTRIYVTFSAAKKYFSKKRCSLERYPVRFSLQDQAYSLHAFPGFTVDRKTIFLLGGSQGSLQLNQALKVMLQSDSELCKRVQVIHQTGETDTTDWNAFYQEHSIPAVIFSYTHEIQTYYQAADVVITRAGAGTLFELLFFKKKSIVVPLQARTTSHQNDNAQAMVEAYPDLFIRVLQHDMQVNPDVFHKTVKLALG